MLSSFICFKLIFWNSANLAWMLFLLKFCQTHGNDYSIFRQRESIILAVYHMFGQHHTVEMMFNSSYFLYFFIFIGWYVINGCSFGVNSWYWSKYEYSWNDVAWNLAGIKHVLPNSLLERILTRNGYWPGLSDTSGTTLSWPGSKTGLEPNLGCRTSPYG